MLRHAYNAAMRAFVRPLLPFLLCSLALSSVRAEEPPARTMEPPHPGRRHGESPHGMTPEERAAWREERRARREPWRQMSPEERHQLRRDIREAGDAIYPRGPHHPRKASAD